MIIIHNKFSHLRFHPSDGETPPASLWSRTGCLRHRLWRGAWWSYCSGEGGEGVSIVRAYFCPLIHMLGPIPACEKLEYLNPAWDFVDFLPILLSSTFDLYFW